MAIANLHETLLNYKLRKNQLQLDITEWQSQKTLAQYAQGDAQSLHQMAKHSARDYFKNLYESDEALQEKYTDYTEIPDFEDEIDKLTAQYQDELAELTAWETAIDAQITTADAEIKEIEAYTESMKSMLTSNISEDFNYQLNG